LFLPSTGWGDFSGQFLVDVLAVDSNGLITMIDPNGAGLSTTPLIAPAGFGAYSGHLFVSDQGGTNAGQAVWQTAPAVSGDTAHFHLFRDKTSVLALQLAPWGLEFTPPEWGPAGLLVSDGATSVDNGPNARVSRVVSLDPTTEANDHIFATIPLRDNPDMTQGQFGLRQMLVLPNDFLVPSLGADGVGKLLLVSVSGSGQGGGVLGETLALNSSGQIKGHLITGSVLSKYDPRGMLLTADSHILISDTSDPILKASATDFAPGRGAVCSVISSVSTAVLWPPNHDLVNVGLTATSTCPAATNVATYSNEDDAADTGDGNFSPDAKNIAPDSLRLRSERNGNGGGRVYLIVVKSTDATGTVASSCNTVVVPHSQSKKDKDAVDAKAAAAKAYCQQHSGASPSGYFVVGDGPIIGSKQ